MLYGYLINGHKNKNSNHSIFAFNGAVNEEVLLLLFSYIGISLIRDKEYASL